jgi:hypothetical protein
MELTKEKMAPSSPVQQGGKPFLQPLAIALVALLVAALFFAMAMFDVRRVERTLLNVLETKGVAIIQGVEHVAELRLTRFLGIAENRQDDARLDPSALDNFFTAQETLSAELIGLAATSTARMPSKGRSPSNNCKPLRSRKTWRRSPSSMRQEGLCGRALLCRTVFGRKSGRC